MAYRKCLQDRWKFECEFRFHHDERQGQQPDTAPPHPDAGLCRSLVRQWRPAIPVRPQAVRRREHPSPGDARSCLQRDQRAHGQGEAHSQGARGGQSLQQSLAHDGGAGRRDEARHRHPARRPALRRDGRSLHRERGPTRRLACADPERRYGAARPRQPASLSIADTSGTEDPPTSPSTSACRRP